MQKVELAKRARELASRIYALRAEVKGLLEAQRGRPVSPNSGSFGLAYDYIWLGDAHERAVGVWRRLRA